MIVLHWIKTPPHTLKTYVSNRVAQIQQGTQYSQWRHVPSLHNPADSLSRGTDPVELQNNSLWYNGPQWLTSNPSAWPSQQLNTIEFPEQRTVTVLNTVTAPSQDLTKRFLTLQRLTRTIAYCARFHHNTTKNPRIIGPLTVEEIQEANTRILKAVQGQEFATDITALTNKDMRYKGRLGTHNPVVDEIGLLRVEGGWHTQRSHQTHATQSSYQPSITSPNW